MKVITDNKIVFILWFEREYADRSDTELLIGIFDTKSHAKSAIKRLKNKPGFREFPDGFKIYARTLGEMSWEFGFTTKWLPRLATDCKLIAFDLPAYDQFMAPEEPPANDC